MTPPSPPSLRDLQPEWAAAASADAFVPPSAPNGAAESLTEPPAPRAPRSATQAAYAFLMPSLAPAGVSVSPSEPSASDLQEEAEAAAAAVAVVAAARTPPPTSLAAPFPSPPTARRRVSGGSASGGKKRTPAKALSAKTSAPPRKKTKKAAQEANGDCDNVVSHGASNAAATTPEVVAAWTLVRGEVAKAVREGNKALWSALKQSTAQIEHLRADTNRLEVRVDVQGQRNGRTALRVASVRLELKGGSGADVAGKEVSRSTGSRGTGSTKGDGAKDVKAVVKVEDAKATAMALAPDSEAQAATLRRPLRAVVKKRVAMTTDSREVLIDPDTAVDVIQDIVVQAFAVSAVAAHNYMMNGVYFPYSVRSGMPTKKRPVAVIMSTIPHTVAQLREFVLKPFSKVLGFEYNPMPISKAKKWSKKDYFLTSYKGEKAVVAAAKNLFTKIGGGSRIVKDKSVGSRYHVNMVVGHHALIASFVRNEFEIALGRRTRRRGGNGNGSYMHWVDEFDSSIKHLSKNHKDCKVHAGYRITDAIDPDMVVRTSAGGWMFTELGDASLAKNAPGSSALTTSARPPTSINRTVAASPGDVVGARAPSAEMAGGGAPSGGADKTRRPGLEDVPDAPMRNCTEDYRVGPDQDDNVHDSNSHAPRTGVAIVVDADTDHGSGAAMIGLHEEGARREGAGDDGGGGNDGGGDGGESEDVGARTFSSDDDDSDSGPDSSDEGGESAGVPGDNEDEEEDDGVF